MSTAAVTSRRAFLKSLGCGACAMCADRSFVRASGAGQGEVRTQVAVHDAMWFETLEDNAVRCKLCPRECVVADVERGYCGVRENRGGEYKTLVYGTLCSMNADPIEKKPLFHYLPGTTAFSVATPGCNMECKFCQNWEISQFRPEQVTSYLVPPQDLVQRAVSRNSPTIAYTYSEPVIFYEYVHDTAALGRHQGVGSVLISNGYILEEPLRQLCQQLTAVKIDLKGFTEAFYADHCAARLAPVLDALDVLADIGIHTEVVVLLIPTLNDSAAEIRGMARWLVAHMGPDVPVHFTRFRPIYRMKNLPPTPVAVLERARRIALDAGLHYVYVGNVMGHEGGSTYCPTDGTLLIGRAGFWITENNLTADGRCPTCNEKIPGVWK